MNWWNTSVENAVLEEPFPSGGGRGSGEERSLISKKKNEFKKYSSSF